MEPEFPEIQLTTEVQQLLSRATTLAQTMRHEFLLPEHILKIISDNRPFISAFRMNGGNPLLVKDQLTKYLESLSKVPEDIPYELTLSFQTNQMFNDAIEHLISADRTELGIEHILRSMYGLDKSAAAEMLKKASNGNFASIFSAFCSNLEYQAANLNPDRRRRKHNYADSYIEGGEEEEAISMGRQTQEEGEWRNLVVCVNETVDRRNPLIGREKELERTIQILCRKEKNNPLHVGEPGVGKTALVYGLARLINEGQVPDRLKGAKIFSIDMGTLLAGTQYRGDFEKRLKMILEGISTIENPIIYLDEIHTLVGAGSTGEGAMDASNMLKPYLEAGKIRFIGSTTFDEYKRYFAKSKGLVRRFSRLDIEEPSVAESIKILTRLQPEYEKFHGVTYLPEAIRFAVEGSARHINDRFLPDKAIDLIDEAGSYASIHCKENGTKPVLGEEQIAEVLAKVSRVEAVSVKEDGVEMLEKLEENIKKNLYGQDEAVARVVEAIQMSKAGLSDEQKPLASLLFVGPTGVGKTELAKQLSEQLGVKLVRFDMSEYSEKHSVAKLIGAPAGYVGYDDGGLLTDAIRKSPDCVLLLDEIEKAHADIYNVLLQVMDYGRLTDNRGQGADFRNVTVIMTSNAGARYAAQANVGFGNSVTKGSAMMTQVKKTFQPEFLNRLSSIVVFNDMDHTMAEMILDRKLGELGKKLAEKNVNLMLSPEAREHLLKKGFSEQYGAREMDRVINRELMPLLMRELLFGKFKNDGGEAEIILDNGKLTLNK